MASAMKRKPVKAIRTIDEFDASFFSDLQLGVELQDFTEPALPDFAVYKMLRRYERKLADFHFTKAMHGSFLDVDIASFNLDFARYSKKLYLRDLFFAKVLDLDYVIFHANTKLRYANQNAFTVFANLQKDFFAEALDATGFSGTVVLENVLDAAPTYILSLLNTIRLPQVKMNFDFGHAKLSSTPIADWIAATADKIGYVHLHSNNGIDDVHNPVTAEDAALLTKILDEYTIQVPLSLEYWDCDLKHEIERLKNLL